MNPQKVAGTYSLPYTIKAEWTAYLIFSIIFGPIAILCLIVTFINPSAWQGSLVILFLLAGFLTWIGAFKIVVEEDRIVYKTLFSGQRGVPVSNIKRIAIEVGLDSKKASFYRLVIYGEGLLAENPLEINMKPFSKRDLAVLADAITAKVPSVEMDNAVRSLKEGDFKSIISMGIRQIWQAVLILLGVLLILGIFCALVRVWTK